VTSGTQRSFLANVTALLASLLVASVLCLALGAFLLYYFDLVPIFLIELTFAVVAVLLILAMLVERKNLIAVYVGTALGVIAPLFSLSTPAHVTVLLTLGRAGILLDLLGILQLFGFYLFPITYVILSVVYHRRIVNASNMARKSIGK
jgi:hypothetical protein